MKQLTVMEKRRCCVKGNEPHECRVNVVNGVVTKRIVAATRELAMLTRVIESIRQNIEMQARISENKMR